MEQIRETRIKHLAAVLTGILLALSAAFVLQAWRGGHLKSVDSLRAYLDTLGCWGPIVLTVIQALQVLLPVLPSMLGCIAGAMMFGPLVGFLINYIGICAGSILAFWLAKRFGIKLVRKMVSVEKYERFTNWIMQKKSYSIVLFLAILLPFAPDDYLCYLSGLTPMPTMRFVWIILLAKPWVILVYSVFFAYLL